VALFLALGACSRKRLLRTAVSRHPALWSPDFPLPARKLAATVWPTSRRMVSRAAAWSPTLERW